MRIVAVFVTVQSQATLSSKTVGSARLCFEQLPVF